MLSKKQLSDVCQINGACDACRYVHQDELDWSKYYCLKLRPIEKQKIDERLQEKLNEFTKSGVDPHKTDVPFGDNCKGYPLLKNIQQGYDIP